MTKKNKVTRPDNKIAEDIRQALRLDSDVPDERIRVEVHNGFATIGGSVDQNLQKEAAQNDANKVRGVRGVTNRIEVMPEALGVQAR
jgi:osmotically-inducible protein OsmY